MTGFTHTVLFGGANSYVVRSMVRSLMLAGMVSAAFLTSACSTLETAGDNISGWFVSDDDTPLPGDRIAVLADESDVTISATLRDSSLNLPAPLENTRWPQVGGNAANYPAHLKIDADPAFVSRNSADAGDGEGWDTPLVIAPVVADGRVYSMDVESEISARSVENIDDEIWDFEMLSDDEEEHVLPGGGLAVSGDHLIAVNGNGDVVALALTDGTEIWRRSLDLPVRAAPTVSDGLVLIKTVDNQLFALGVDDSVIRWQHRGIVETAGVLGSPMAAVSNGMVLVPYSSGELYALDVLTGQDIWKDELVSDNKTQGASRLTDIAPSPVMMRERVIAGAQGGLLAAIDMRTGIRIWERQFAGVLHIWGAGDYAFVLTRDGRVAAVHVADGRVRWVRVLADYMDEDDRDETRWAGSMLLNGKLYVFGIHGEAEVLNPVTGALVARLEWPEDTHQLPAVARGALFVVTQDADLVSLR